MAIDVKVYELIDKKLDKIINKLDILNEWRSSHQEKHLNLTDKVGEMQKRQHKIIMLVGCVALIVGVSCTDKIYPIVKLLF